MNLYDEYYGPYSDYNDDYMYTRTRNKTFSDIWSTADAFVTDYKSSGLEQKISETNASNLWYLLYSRHGNDSIAPSDEYRFKAAVWSNIFMYGPAWQERLKLQNDLIALTVKEMQVGGKAVYNRALNPSTEPSTDTLYELLTINEQNTTNYMKTPAEAIGIKWELLKTDVTNEFLRKFDKLFLVSVQEMPRMYRTKNIGGDD